MESVPQHTSVAYGRHCPLQQLLELHSESYVHAVPPPCVPDGGSGADGGEAGGVPVGLLLMSHVVPESHDEYPLQHMLLEHQ